MRGSSPQSTEAIAARVLAEFERNPEAWGDGSEKQIRKLIEDWSALASVEIHHSDIANQRQEYEPDAQLSLLAATGSDLDRSETLKPLSTRRSGSLYQIKKLSKPKLVSAVSLLLSLCLMPLLYVARSDNNRLRRDNVAYSELAEPTLRESRIILGKLRKSSPTASPLGQELSKLVKDLRDVEYQLFRVTNHGPKYSGDRSVYTGKESHEDGTDVTQGQKFVKTWIIRNAGTVDWKGRFVRRQGPPNAVGKLRSEKMTSIDATKAGELCEIRVELTAPDQLGLAYAEWKMVDAEGNHLMPTQDPLYILINVVKK